MNNHSFWFVCSKLNSIKVNIGPRVFINKACENFAAKYGRENCYIQDDFLVHTQEREFDNAEELIRYIFTPEHINLIKVGKNLKKTLIKTHKFIEIDEMENEGYLEFLDDFINPGQYIVR